MARNPSRRRAVLSRLVGVTCVLGVSGTLTLPFASSAQAPYEVSVTHNVMVLMRDGTRLATDIYRPARDGQPVAGKWPVVLFRIPYDKERPGTIEQGHYFARNGYVYVAQDARGRFHSEGVYHPLSRIDLRQDGYDAAAWITAQEWSNGKIATVGVSYGGLTQTTLGSTNPPGLTAQYIREIYDNSYRGGFWQAGAFRLWRIAWVLRMAANSKQALADPRIAEALAPMHQDTAVWLEHFPLAFRRGTSPLALVPNIEEFLAGGIENDRYGPYWKKFGLDTDVDWDTYADVPVLHVGAWYDIHNAFTPDLYNSLAKRKKGVQHLLMGPWVHAAEDASFAGNVEFGPDAAVDINALGLRWYDQFLRGVNNGLVEEPPVRIFVMGGGDGHRTPEGRIFHGGEWRFEREWPLARTQYTDFFIHADGSLDRRPPTGRSAPTAYIHDPRDPVPTAGGVDGAYLPWTDAGGFDQRDVNGVPLKMRRDVLVFQTASLEEDIEVTGPITASIFASSSVTNTDFTVKLVDVYPSTPDWPEGYELNISDGIVRATHRESVTEPTPIDAGRIYEFTIVVPPTSNLFKRGHRIRVDISSSNFPRFDINPGTTDSPWERRRYITAENKVYHDAEHRSRIILPVIPR